MSKKSKIGILKYIAGTGAKGVKFEDQPETWYNPATDEAKEQVKSEYKGKKVEIMLADGKKTEFTSMVLLETDEEETGEQPIVVEEVIEENPTTKKEEPAEEEKGPQPPPKEEAMRKTAITDECIYGRSPLQGLIEDLATIETGRLYTHKVYSDMEKTKLDTAKKGTLKLTYASWSEAWGALKRLHPTSTFKVHENKEEMPVFYDKDKPAMGAFVKVSVKVMGLTHTVHLPVMDHANKSLSVGSMSTFDINKNIQRALAKAIALHGMGLYVFKGEDYPEDKPTKK